jgi:GT2 family glycosyltransferase
MTKHDEAIVAFQQGRMTEALRLLEELLATQETSELWSDWGAIQLGAGHSTKAEAGFSRAVELNSQNTDAIANLGLLLLSRGDLVRAIPLLKQALPTLPTQQQELVGALLAARAEKTSSSDKSSSEERSLRVLVISDTFPDPGKGDNALRLMHLLRAFREHGDDVTLIAREAVNNKRCEPLLHKEGIHTYGDDVERFPHLGREAGESSWSFSKLVEQTKFDIAILVQSFRHGLTVPEQYLDGLRQSSAAIRIAVLPDQLHIGGLESNLLPDFERAEDWAARQSETLERADVVLVRNEREASQLRKRAPNLQIEIVAKDLDPAGLANVRQQLLSVIPKAPSEKGFSVMLVETLFRESLLPKSGKERFLGQLECYVRLAEQYLREGNPEDAREQMRHVFGRLEASMRTGYFVSQVFIVLKRCYRELGNMKMAERCAVEARRCITAQQPVTPVSKRLHPPGPSFSVIVPTYNRLPILRKCLAALEAQTFSSSDFEVIVIDDGSSDGTEELLSQYRPAFQFKYLRQTNSGTGAARRNGVAHASGEYLLLMNDDTICASDLLEQHIQVQKAHGAEQWAVLGNFEYPAAARQRALTRYFCVEPFMFPQVSMEDGCPYGYSHFITCNMSVRRDAVVEVGSFDSTYKLSEDTELGIRLHEQGYRVLYHPSAHAFHDHLPYPTRNLIRRSRVYGADYFHMFRKHPRVMREWTMPVKLTGMDEANAMNILGYVEAHRQEVEEAVTALERWDSIDFEPFLTDHSETGQMVLRLFQQAVPAIHWFYLFETMFHTMIRELGLSHLAAKQPLTFAAHSAGD